MERRAKVLSALVEVAKIGLELMNLEKMQEEVAVVAKESCHTPYPSGLMRVAQEEPFFPPFFCFLRLPVICGYCYYCLKEQPVWLEGKPAKSAKRL